MTTIKCDRCQREVCVNMYFSDRRIVKQTSLFEFNAPDYWDAIAIGKFICPLCGEEIKKTFKRTITSNEILILAGALDKDSNKRSIDE